MKYRIKIETEPLCKWYTAQETDAIWPICLLPESAGSWRTVDTCPDADRGKFKAGSLELAKANIDYAIYQRKRYEDFRKQCKKKYAKYP